MNWIDVAKSQSGAIDAGQLMAAGVTGYRRQTLLASGALEEAGAGVFRLGGHSRTWEEECWLSLLRAGKGAFLYRGTAANLWELDSIQSGHLEIAVPASRRPRLVKVTRIRTLRADDLCVHRGFPVTSPLRTLIDLSSVLDADDLERALESALRRRLVDLDQLSARVASGRPSAVGRLSQVLSSRPAGCVPTESDAETVFEILARRLGLPSARRQFVVILRGRKYRIDFAWPDVRLAVEIDGAAVHGPSVFDRDIARQNQIVLDGWLILRFGWHALTRDRRSVERDLLTAWNVRTASTMAWRRLGNS